MIFGIDNFASVEFATTLWHDIKNWIEVCDHPNVEWDILAKEDGDWTKQCSVASNPWQDTAVETNAWSEIQKDESNPWVKPDLPANDITRC